MSNDKERADVLLVQQGFFDSREKAKAAVMAGIVFLGNERVEKPGMKIPRNAALGLYEVSLLRGNRRLSSGSFRVEAFRVPLVDARLAGSCRTSPSRSAGAGDEAAPGSAPRLASLLLIEEGSILEVAF